MNLMRSMTMAFFFLCLYDGLIAPNARASGEESWTRCHHHTEGSVPGGDGGGGGGTGDEAGAQCTEARDGRMVWFSSESRIVRQFEKDSSRLCV